MRLLLGCLAVFLLLTPAASRQLTAIRVSEGDDLQAAIHAARPGDVLLLAPGARFVGNFVLPARDQSTAFTTIRTDGPHLPPAGVRTGPAYAGHLAVLQSPSSEPALRTAPGAHHWRLENLEFRWNAGGYGNIIALGDGSPAQRTLADAPHTLVLDRLYVRGHPELGQKRGIALNSAATEILNCHISDIKGLGMDTQAIAGWNGPGPYRIENNYLEAAGENLIFGGADPSIPDLIPTGIEVRRNTIRKPVEWRRPLVDTPDGLRAVASGEGGSLPKAAHVYSVAAERPAGQGATAVSAASVERRVTLNGTSTGSVRLEWTPVAGASGYRVYRMADGGESMMWQTAEPRFTDTGATGAAARPPKRSATWTVKNLFELKSARDVTFDGNVLEHNWLDAQTGYAIVLKPTNQDGRAPWTTVENVRLTNNIVRHVASAINLRGVDDRHPSQRARGIVIRNNLFVDVDGGSWGGSGDFVQIGGGPSGVVVEHNTVAHTGRVIAAYGGRGGQVENFVFRNNLLRHNRYGVKGDSTATGLATLTAFLPGAVFEGNVLAGGDRSRYPARNHFPSEGDFEAQFVNAAAGDYRLRPDSPFRGAGAGGRDIGATLDEIQAATGASTSEPAAPATPRQSRD